MFPSAVNMIAPAIESIEISSSSDAMSTSNMSLDLGSGGDNLVKYDTREVDWSSPSVNYCSEWVLGLGRVPTIDTKGYPTSTSMPDLHTSKPQSEIEEWDSEAEVENLIQVEILTINSNKNIQNNNEGLDKSLLRNKKPSPNDKGYSATGFVDSKNTLSSTHNYDGPIHAPKPQNAEDRVPLSHPTSCMRMTAMPVSRYSTFYHVPFEPRTPEPGDWSGPKHGDIHYMLLPLHLLFLLDIGSMWSFSRTAPTSHCRNRIVGDIHFTPGEVKGYSYWVCRTMEGAQFGRGWVPWNPRDTHPLYPELMLLHFNCHNAPSWVRKLEE